MITIGMDVHVRNSYLHVTDDSGNLIRRGRCKNMLTDLSDFLLPVEKLASTTGESVQVVLESTTNSRAVLLMMLEYGRLAGLDLTVEVLDARKNRIIAESVCKCDRLDAEVLSDLARSNLKLPTCYMPDDEEFGLREHLRARSDLIRVRTSLKNRVHSVMHRRGILTPVGGVFTKAGRTFLSDVKLDEAGRVILNRFLETTDHMDLAVNESTKSLRVLMARSRWSKSAALLQTMPGIGLITSLTILAELGRLDRFKSRASVANYSGLVPICRSSNDKNYSGRISRRGSSHLRAVMIEAAWVAVPRVPVYAHMFDRIAQKKNKLTAIVAVARRMLEDAFTLLKKDEAFHYVEVSVVDASQQVDTITPTHESRCSREVASSVAG